MRSMEDKDSSNSATNRTSHHHHHHHHNRTALGKPTPSKWDDAQKWLVNLSRGEKNQAKSSPRNSNADDRRLITSVPKKDYSSDEEEKEGEQGSNGYNNQCDVVTKNVVNNNSVVRSICLRDMGTEMTPIASQEPSRTATPVRTRTPVIKSPMSSGSSSPVTCPNGATDFKAGQNISKLNEHGEEVINGVKVIEKKGDEESRKMNALENRAMVWEEAERAKYMARFKREEMKIQAWENHQKRKAEMENRKVEVKAERLKSRAQEKYSNKLASTRRIAEEKRANAEAKLQEKAMKTSERADYIRRTGHLPSCFSFKWPCSCSCKVSYCCW